MSPTAKVQAYLDEIGAGLQVMNMTEDTSTSELAAAALGVAVGQIAKSLLFKSKDNYFMLVAAGDRRVDGKRIKELAGARVRMATPDETLEITGYPVGGVCPFALNTPLPIYVDESLKRFDRIFPAAGNANSAIPTSYERLIAVTRAVECSVCP
ncbi:MAG: YbaK/EbsC family protein [Solirubrobacterales bacterium]